MASERSQPEDANMDDLELVKRIQNGDGKLFGILYQKYYHQAYLLALRVLNVPADAEEAAGESFLKAYQKMGAFRRQSAFYTWLYRIVMNESLAALKKRGRLVSLERNNDRRPGNCADAAEYSRYLEGSGSGSESVEQHFIRKERAGILREVMAELPLEDRLVLSLRFEQDLSYDEIAEIMKLPRNTVGIRLFRVKKILAKKLRERGINE